VSGLVLLVLRQVMPIAARLGGGVALASFGVMGAAANRSIGQVLGVSSRAGHSLLDRAAFGYQNWREAGLARVATSSFSMPGKVTPAWRAVGRG
jgi:hypothetical protein